MVNVLVSQKVEGLFMKFKALFSLISIKVYSNRCQIFFLAWGFARRNLYGTTSWMYSGVTPTLSPTPRNPSMASSKLLGLGTKKWTDSFLTLAILDAALTSIL
jgi:hypothetical protein